jgi:hypothetical protein
MVTIGFGFYRWARVKSNQGEARLGNRGLETGAGAISGLQSQQTKKLICRFTQIPQIEPEKSASIYEICGAALTLRFKVK